MASAIETLKSGGGTAIADAILSASEAMEHVDGRHIFVLFTDGYDEHSSAKLDEAMEADQASCTARSTPSASTAPRACRSRAAKA